MRRVLRIVLALLYATAGFIHLALPAPFLSIMPRWVPWAPEVVLLTGLAELAGAAALLQPRLRHLRRAGAIGLALYAVCVFPANINHFLLDMTRADGGLGLAYHLPRLALQPVIVWLALWTGELTDWPWRRSVASEMR